MEQTIFKSLFESPENFLTTNEYLDNIEPFDSALYIVGVVKKFDNDDKERVVNKATNQKSTVFNFALEGVEGLFIHLCCWKENMPILEGKIITNNVLLIDAPFARPTKSAHFQDGRRYQLTIRPNTKVYLLRDTSPSKVLLPSYEEAIHYKTIKEILLTETGEEKVPIAIEVWIKQGLRMKDANVAICVVRDNEDFVKLHVTGFTPILESNPKVGDKIKIVAFPTYTDNEVLIFESQFDKIQKVDPNGELYSILGAAASPGKKIKIEKTP